jgi:hypothetical protein
MMAVVASLHKHDTRCTASAQGRLAPALRSYQAGGGRATARLKVCAACNTARYCSAACQEQHWAQHQQQCSQAMSAKAALVAVKAQLRAARRAIMATQRSVDQAAAAAAAAAGIAAASVLGPGSEPAGQTSQAQRHGRHDWAGCGVLQQQSVPTARCLAARLRPHSLFD